MDNPGILRVLRSSPRAEPGVVSAPEQSGAESGHSSGQARPGQTASTEQGSVGSGSLQFCKKILLLKIYRIVIFF